MATRISDTFTNIDKAIFCVNCGQEIKGDTWYAGKFISYTHQHNAAFMCDPMNFNRTDHAEPML